jgi:hypothetical protein
LSSLGEHARTGRPTSFNLGSDPLATNKLLEAELNPVMITFDVEMMRMNKGVWAQQTMKDMKTKWATFYARVIRTSWISTTTKQTKASLTSWRPSMRSNRHCSTLNR